MKHLFFILFAITLNAQTAFQNNGSIQMHNNAEVGFHTNIVNNGTFNQNLGLAGFYNYNGDMLVSGANAMSFNNIEIDVYDDLYLETSLAVTNNLSFITGKVITPRDNLGVSLEFLNYFVYAGENNYNYVDGYASSINNSEFTFPIGDANALRPMLLPIQASNSTYSGAYFKEDPNNPSTFTTSFDTSIKQEILGKISEVEFWDLNGTTETQIVLTWDANSDIQTLTNDVASLRVVGWDIAANQWVDLGGVDISGDLFSGSVQSFKFNPNNYEVITIGSDFRGIDGGDACYSISNGFTPNGDGINDLFVIEGLEFRPDNTIEIFDRWGSLVYRKVGYDNTWNGVSQNSLTFDIVEGLPIGTYFYTLTYYDDNTTCVGYLYLKR